MPRLSRFALLPVAMALASNSWAQSLQEVYDAARAFDATYLAARAQADSAQYRKAQADALMRPFVSGTAGTSAIATDLPPSALNPTGDQVNQTSGTASITGRQPLFNRTNTVTIDQAERALQIADADLTIAEHELIVRVAQTYFDVLVAEETLAAANTGKAAIGEQLASARRNFEVGTATITDTREAQARFDLATAAVIAGENDLHTKRIALDQLVGRSNVMPRKLATPVVLPVVQVTSVDDWVGRAQSGHPAVVKSDLNLQIAKLETEKARAGHLPTLDAVANLGSTRLSHYGAVGTTTIGSLGLQLAVPIYAGHSVQNRIKETLALEERSRNDLDASRRGVAQATRQAFYSYQSGQAQVKALEAAESSSKLALESTQLGYRVGVRVNLDVLNAQTQLFNTQRDLAQAQYGVLLTGLRLRQASGTLQPADIGVVSGLMVK